MKDSNEKANWQTEKAVYLFAYGNDRQEWVNDSNEKANWQTERAIYRFACGNY